MPPLVLACYVFLDRLVARRKRSEAARLGWAKRKRNRAQLDLPLQESEEQSKVKRLKVTF